MGQFLLPLLAAIPLAQAANNGIGLTPPMGWRNWNFFQGNISQDIMEETMRAMAARTRSAVGRQGKTSLIDLGYDRAGLDDAWQACASGVSGSFHDANGKPLWNTTRFPDVKAMVALGHSLGLQVGWYDNNCICGEGSAHLSPAQVAKNVKGDVDFLLDAGFDGLKADGCGPGRDLVELAGLLNATGKPILIENCHYYKWPNSSLPSGARADPGRNRIYPYWKDNITGGKLMCQENLFRTSADIRNSWDSWFGNLASLAPYQDLHHPISQPGCWAYADMLMVGVHSSDFAPQVGPAASLVEWRSHFGAWAINSSPLVLSFDLRNETMMDQVWPFISNLEAIEINQNWAGHPGRQIPVSESSARAWAKPLTESRLAVLVVSMAGAGAIDVELDVAAIAPSLPCVIEGDCLARNVWEHVSAGRAESGKFAVTGLAPRDSAFLIFSSPGTSPAVYV